MSSPELKLSDIVDHRAYEAEREGFRRRIIELKKIRRVFVGEFQTLLFENRDTIRFQIQEMARAERILSDEGIETELRIYNPLISRPNRLSATLFIELTSDEQLREWLPKLVGIERSYELRIGEGPDQVVIPCQVDAAHDDALTREEVTASVHYVWFDVGSDVAQRFADGPVVLMCTHPDYEFGAILSPETRSSLAADLG